MIISAFPAMGKSYMYNKLLDKLKIMDSDSSKFSHETVDIFIKSYLDHIKEFYNNVDVMFISSHDTVRKALRDNKLFYTIIIPKENMKEIILDRMRNRNSPDGMIQMFIKFYDKFIDEILEEKRLYPKTHNLVRCDYVSDIFDGVDDNCDSSTIKIEENIQKIINNQKYKIGGIKWRQ